MGGAKQLAVEPVTLRSLQMQIVSKVVGWLKDNTVRESFVPAFPESEIKLQGYFRHPTREYFSIDYTARHWNCRGQEYRRGDRQAGDEKAKPPWLKIFSPRRSETFNRCCLQSLMVDLA